MFSTRLKNLRKNLNHSQKDVAISLGVPSTTYASWEQGKSEPSSNMLAHIADYFNISTDYLLCRTNNPQGLELPFSDLTDDEKEMLAAVLAAYRAQKK